MGDWYFMAYCGIGYANLKKAMRMATSKNFGVSFSGFDCSLLVCFGLLAVGVACFAVRQESFPMQVASIATGAICMLSIFLSYRMMVPFVLWITHVDMLRVRRPFYIWLCCSILMVCTSDPFLELLSGRSGVLLQVALTILSAGLAIEHFRRGRLCYLFLSAGAVGVVVGLSAFGVCAFVLLLAILFLVRRMLRLELENGDGPADVEPNWVLERLINPSALSGVRFVMAVCFFFGVAASIAGKVHASGNGIRYLIDCFVHEWLHGLSIDGVAVLVVLGIIPLLFVLSRVRAATDTMRLLDLLGQVGYFMVVCGIGVFLLLGGGVLKRLQIPIAADVRYWMLGTVIGGFSLLVSAMVMLVDVFCRVPKSTRQSRVGRKNPISRFCQLVLMIAPVVFTGVVVLLRARSGM